MLKPLPTTSYLRISEELAEWLSLQGFNVYESCFPQPLGFQVDLEFWIMPFHPELFPRLVFESEKSALITDAEGVPVLDGNINSLPLTVYPGSNFTLRNLKQAGLKLPMKVVPRAVNHAKIASIQPASSQSDYIIFIAASYWGMKHQRKGIEEAYEAMRLVNMKYPKLALYHITTNYPEAIGIPLPKDANIIVDQGFGNKSYEEIISLIKGAKMLIAPSHCEGFGLTALEAMACRTPLVYTDCPAQNEFAVGEKVPCYAVEKEMTKYGMLNELHLYKPEDLAQAILNVYENPSYAQELAEKAYEKSLEYNSDKVFPKYF